MVLHQDAFFPTERGTRQNPPFAELLQEIAVRAYQGSLPVLSVFHLSRHPALGSSRCCLINNIRHVYHIHHDEFPHAPHDDSA